MNDEHCALTDNNSGKVEKPVLMLTNMQLPGTHNLKALKMLHRNWFTFKLIFLEVLSNGINHKQHPSKEQHIVQNAVYGKMGLKKWHGTYPTANYVSNTFVFFPVIQ